MPTDLELLKSYARDRSESAFTELVRRHIDLVYSAALRESHGDAPLAADLAQAVFADLAAKASRLNRHPVLAGWLYTCVRHVAANTRRSEARRQRRELEAHQMNELLSTDSAEAAWLQLQPVLDDAMHELNEIDRAAVVLRYFEKRSHKEVGTALGLAESAARMRVERALEKLKSLLAKRGVTSTTSTLAATLAIGGAAAAPSGLAATVATGALSTATLTAGTTSAFLKIMSMTKIQASLAGAMAVACVVTSVLIQQNADAKIRATDAALAQQSDQIAALQKQNEQSPVLRDSSPNQMDELLKLRAEAAGLRTQTNALAGLRAENQRLRVSHAPAQSAASLQDQVAAREESMARLGYGKQLALGVITAAMDNHDQIPTNFDAAMKYVGTDTNIVPDQFEIVYQGTMTQKGVTPAAQILIREIQPRNLNNSWQRVYVFLDGHAEIHSEPTGNFDAYESKNGLKPIPR